MKINFWKKFNRENLFKFSGYRKSEDFLCQKSKKSFILIGLVAFLFVLIYALPMISAQWYQGFYPFRPADLLENEWVMFVILFAIFYSTIFTSLGKVFGGSRAPAVVIAIALAFLVTAGIQRNWMFLERPIMFWTIVLTLILVITTFFRSLSIGSVPVVGTILVVIGFWPFYKRSLGLNVIAQIPYGFVSFLDNLWWVILILGIVLIMYGRGKERGARGIYIQ